jgi:formylglycine-generating enzyme required for sulfatase activity
MKLAHPGGEFEMACWRASRGIANEGPVHRVRITRAFEMGVHEVTNGQFCAFAEGPLTRPRRSRRRGGFGID